MSKERFIKITKEFKKAQGEWLEKSEIIFTSEVNGVVKNRVTKIATDKDWVEFCKLQAKMDDLQKKISDILRFRLKK